MHELSLSMSMVALLTERCHGEGMTQITRVVLEVGALSGVEIESLRFCFDVATRGTPAEGASLSILPVPGRGRCTGCGQEFPLAHLATPCTRCGAYGATLLAGQELYVREFEGG